MSLPSRLCSACSIYSYLAALSVAWKEPAGTAQGAHAFGILFQTGAEKKKEIETLPRVWPFALVS